MPAFERNTNWYFVLVRDILERHGYRVLVAAALTVSHAFQGDIHLLLANILMPRMSGMKVATCLTAARPLIKVLYMSGHAETVVSEQGRVSRPIFSTKTLPHSDACSENQGSPL